MFWTKQNKFPSTWKKTDLFDLKRIQTVLTGIDKAKKQKIILLNAPTVWLQATYKQSLEEHNNLWPDLGVKSSVSCPLPS